MLNTKTQAQSFLGPGEDDFNFFLTYMGMAAILLNGVEPFEQIFNIPISLRQKASCELW